MTKIHFITQGCSLNKADTETMKGLLYKAGFQITNIPEKADLIIYNTCTVKGPTENFFKKKLKELKQLEVPIIIAGCIAQTDTSLAANHTLVGVDQIGNIVEVVEETLNGNTVCSLYQENFNRLNLPKVRDNSIVEIIPISQGCLGKCTYCKVRQARGAFHSYPKEDILKHAKRAINHHARELWITAQDTGCYGMDRDDNYFLPELINDICSLNGDFKVRVGMANPNHIYHNVDRFIESLKNEKCFKFVHIPVQSGSDSVLERMQRQYTVEQYKEIISKLKEAIPEITIGTDIICGFPGETKEDFENTMKLVEDTRPHVLNISKFWPRPNTPAARMDKKVDGAEIKNRSSRLTGFFEYITYEENKKWRGWEGEILIDEKNNQGFTGRNYAYKQVIVEGYYELGQKIKVRVINNTIYDLRAVKI